MSGFSDLADRLAQLVGLPSRIVGEVADGINTELRSEFESGANAYGNAWAPLLPQTVARKRGDSRPLRRTDGLMNQTVARPTSGAGIDITSLDFGTFHQGGTVHMVPRKILPDGSAQPPSWQRVIETAKANAFTRAMR